MERRDVWELAEYRLLCRAVREACCLLGRGDDFAGYRCLALGLERLSELAQSGLDWAAEVADSYLAALHYYACLPRWRREPV